MNEERLSLKEKFQKMDKNKLIFYLVIIMCVALVISVVFTAWSFHILTAQYPGTRSQFSYKQHSSIRLLEHCRDLAEDLEVQERSSVQEALADFSYDIETASTSDDLVEIILDHPTRVKDIIYDEWEEEFKENIIEAVNQDEGIAELDDYTQVAVKLSDNGIDVEPYNFLSASTESRAKEMYSTGDFIGEQVIEMEINEGEAKPLVKESEEDYVEILSEEVDSLRESLRELREESGYSEKNGEGIVVKIYDEAEATDSHSIVHDTDIRDVVNEMYASGAEGVAVGGQRLTVTSSIRCTGPLIKVDDNLIPVNPVEVKAVGDSDLLSSGVDIIRNTLEDERELYFEIEKKDSITLPSYTES